MNEEIKRDEEKLKFLAISQLTKENPKFNSLYQKHRKMLDAYEKSPEALIPNEYDKPIEQCERDLKRIAVFSDNDYGTTVYDFDCGDGTITGITGILNRDKRVVVRYRLLEKRHTLKDFSEKCFFYDTDYGFTVCPSCKRNLSSQKGKPCLVCQNAEVTEVKYLLEEIEKRKDEIYEEIIEVYPFPQPKPPKPPRGSDNEPHCWNCHEKIVKLPWLRCPKCNGYICQSCGECLCGFGFNRGEKRKEEQNQP